MYQRNYLLIITILFFFIPSLILGQLSGTYTIGPAGNYTSFKAAANDLTGQGVSGAVTFQVQPGTYTEHIAIGAISGSSAANTITFQGTSAAQCTLTYNATQADSNYIVELTNTQFIRFRDLTFVAQQPNYGRIFLLLQGVNDMELTGSKLHGVLASGASVNRAIFFTRSQWPDSIRIYNNDFFMGGYGIHLSGRSDNFIYGAKIYNNTFTDGGYQSISVEYGVAPQIHNNTVINSSDGIYLRQILANTQIYNNRLSVRHHGMELSVEGYTTDRARIYNNFVTSSGPAGIIMSYNSFYYDVCYNSINVIPAPGGSPNPIATSSALKIDQGVAILVRNNNLANQAGGYAYYNTANTWTFDSDYNNLYSPGNNLAYFNGKCPDLSAFQDSTGQDLHSLSVYPHYASDSDLHSIAPWLDEKAIPLTDISVDIDGDSRDPSLPDIGADEFSPPAGSKIPLAGSKTVGTGGDYTTPNEAITDLQLRGVSAPVTFNLFSGTYPEQIQMVSIPGASQTNNITFQAASGNPADVIISYSASSNEDNFVWRLFGCDNIKIKNLTLTALGSNFATVLVIWGRADSLVIENNIFNGVSSTSALTRRTLIYALQSDYNSRLIQQNNLNQSAFGMWMGNSGSGILGGSLQILENTIDNDGYGGIFLVDHHSAIIDHNEVKTESYGLDISGCDDTLRITNNRINTPYGGLDINSCIGTPAMPGIISNNFINSRNAIVSASTGIYIANSSYQHIIYNSICLKRGYYSSEALNVASGNTHLTVLNNNFSQLDGGLVYTISSTNAFDALDYNNLYTSGNLIAIWGTERIMHLQDLQAISGLDQHSLAVYPHYLSGTDLHTLAPWLDEKGIPIPGETLDIDGELRDNLSPDIGADEFIPDPQTTTPMNGDYDIGGVFLPTIQSAVDYIVLRGVRGPVNFLLQGTFNEQVDIVSIPGTNSNQPVTFKSFSGNPADVQVNFAATHMDSNYVIRLYGADFITFKDLTISATGTGYARVFDLYKGADSLVFRNNVLNSAVASGNDDDKTIIFSEESQFRSRIIEENTLNQASHSILMTGSNVNWGHTKGLKILNNIISNNGYTGLYLYYQDGMEIIGNQINAGFQGMLASNCDSGIVIAKNQIDAIYDYGFRITSCSANPANPGMIANNFIHIGGSVSGTGLSLSSSNNQNVYHNSIHVTSTSPTNGKVIYTNVGSGLNIVGNILTNSGGGYTYDAYNPSGINSSDYNDIYTTGPVLASWNGNQANLAALQAASGMDVNSISVDPAFTSQTNLHTSLPALDAAGTPLAEVTEDIDGQPRHPLTPDIGADEFMIGTNNPPTIISPIGDVAYDEDTGPHLVTADLNTVFDDPDPGDFLTFGTFSDNPDIQVYTQNRVTLFVNSSLNYAGSGEIIITATDFASHSISDTFLVTINPINDPPVAVDDYKTILTSTATAVHPLQNDYDPDNDPLTISNTSIPLHGSAVIDIGDTTITYTPTTGYNGPDTLHYIINDQNGALDTATIFISVEGPFTMFDPGLENLSHGSPAWGDFDSDGDLDILLTGQKSAGSDYQSIIYRNDNPAAGLFNFHQSLTGVRPGNAYGAAWGDYDNDGDLDIIITGDESGNPTNKITKIYNNNGGFFVDINTNIPGVWEGSVAWGDYDTDGDLDLLLTGNRGVGSYISEIYRNDGPDQASGWIFSPIGAQLTDIWQGAGLWGDFDNDSDLDILLYGVYASGLYTTKIYRNDDTNFVDINAGLTGIFNGCGAWGDYDSDGDLDILLSGDKGLFEPISKIYRNDGSGIFTDINANIDGIRSGSCSWGDYDNDGDLDLIVLGTDTFNVTITKIYENDNYTFPGTAISLTGFYWSAATWGDYDNDLDLDILITGIQDGGNRYTQIVRNNSASPNTPPMRPSYRGWARGYTTLELTWHPANDMQTPSAGLSYNLKVGTTPGGSEILSPMSNPDGYRKVVAMGNTNGDTTWTIEGLVPGADYYLSVQTIDNTFTGSQFTDELNLKTQSPYFYRLQPGITGVKSGEVEWGDYDSDGDLDLAICGYHSPGSYISKIYRNDDSTFVDIGANLIGVYNSALAWGDYDNDNDLDLVITGTDAGNYYAKLYRNDNENFVDTHIGFIEMAQGAVAWGDYDNDGDLDLLASGWHVPGNARTTLYQNNNGEFTTINPNLIGAWDCAVAWGDYDLDGDLDILLSGWTTQEGYVTKIYENENAIFSEDGTISLPQVKNSSAAWGDYDADGYLDILLSGLAYTPPDYYCVTKVFRNNQNGNFEDIYAPIDSVHNGAVAWGDIDNNGYLDIILTGNNDPLGNTPMSKIYRYSNGSYESIFTYLTGVLNSSIDLGDYDGDGKLDFVQTGEDDFGNFVCEIYHNVHSGFNSIPDAPAGLSSLVNNSAVTLSWQPGSDVNTPTAGLTYNLRVGTTPGGSEIMSAMAQTDGTRKIAGIGNTNHLTSWQIRNPLPADKYYWSVQTIDNIFAGSAFAVEDSFSMDLYSQTYYQSGINGIIGDMQAIMDTINVNMGAEMLPQYQLVDVYVLIDSIQHTAVGDLEITLIHNSLEDTLIHQAGGDGDNFFHTRLADSASIPISGGTPPFTGIFQPYQPLNMYQGLDPNGAWILKVYDGATGNTGTLDAWGLTLVFEMTTGIDDPLTAIPMEYQLYQNYPNPFNPATHIKFDLPKTGKVKILIYNVLGQRISTLVDKEMPAGRYNYLWKPRGIASGLYFYSIQAEGFHDVKKMILMK